MYKLQPTHYCLARYCGNGLSFHPNKTQLFNLTNGFHFAVRLYSDNAQMTSKPGENKKSLMFHHVLTSSERYQSTDPRQNGIYLFYTITKTFQHIS